MEGCGERECEVGESRRGVLKLSLTSVTTV